MGMHEGEKGEKIKRGGEKGFLFLIKQNGMKTKGVGEDSKGDRIKSNGVLRRDQKGRRA
jgi:hypothetical protein